MPFSTSVMYACSSASGQRPVRSMQLNSSASSLRSGRGSRLSSFGLHPSIPPACDVPILASVFASWSAVMSGRSSGCDVMNSPNRSWYGSHAGSGLPVHGAYFWNIGSHACRTNESISSALAVTVPSGRASIDTAWRVFPLHIF